MGAYKRWSSISYDSYQNFRLSFSHFRRVSRFPYIQHPLLLFINWRNDSNQQHECSLTHSWMELEPKKKLPLKKFVGGTGKRTFVHKGFRFHFFFLLVHNRAFDREFVNDYFMESVTTKLRSTYYLFIVIPHLWKWGANGITWNIRTYHFSYKISLLILAQSFHPNSFQFVICDHPSFPVRTKIGTHILWIECFISLFHFYLECWWRVYVCVRVWIWLLLREKWKWSQKFSAPYIELNHKFNSMSFFLLPIWGDSDDDGGAEAFLRLKNVHLIVTTG